MNTPTTPEPSEAASGPATGSAAALKARIATMRARRKWSSGHYSVHVDELLELLSLLETIIERQEPPNAEVSGAQKA